MSPNTRRVVLMAIPVIMLAMAGCGTFSPLAPALPRPLPESTRTQLAETAEISMFEGRTGGQLSSFELFEKVSEADAVVFGELHGHPVGLPVAAAIWEDMLRVRDRDETPALLLEFFERDQQLAIDDYVADLIDEDTFKERASRRASSYPDGHRDMLEATKEAGGVVIAANAPRRYVRLARIEGYDLLRSMTPAQRAMFELPPTEGGPDAYRERFTEIMGGMRSTDGSGKPQPGMGVMDFLRAQLVWDATMADSVADALKAGHKPVALVIGRFHVAFDGATVEYVRRMRPGADVLTIVMVDRWSDELADEDRGRGDIVIYAGPIDQGEPDAGSEDEA